MESPNKIKNLNQQILNYLKTATEQGSLAIVRLRQEQLAQVGTFLLTKEGLAADLTRMEYADGRIALVRRNAQPGRYRTGSPAGADTPHDAFTVQRWLTVEEEADYRQLHQLPRLITQSSVVESTGIAAAGHGY